MNTYDYKYSIFGSNNTYIYIDSKYRIENEPIDSFKINANQTNHWIQNLRNSNNFPVNIEQQVYNYKHSLTLTNLIIFIRHLTIETPIFDLGLLVDFYCTNYRDFGAVNSINKNDSFKFLAIYSDIKSKLDLTDSNYTITEISYKNELPQSFRYIPRGEFFFSVKTFDNESIENLERVIALFRLIPYVNDTNYGTNV
jgi:hypothetical protein